MQSFISTLDFYLYFLSYGSSTYQIPISCKSCAWEEEEGLLAGLVLGILPVLPNGTMITMWGVTFSQVVWLIGC
jgi:hypothetical protein